MLTYTLDISKKSQWIRTTPGAAALAQPYFVTEAGLFYAHSRFITTRSGKESFLIFYTFSGEGILSQGGSRISLKPGTALLLDCRRPQSYRTAPNSDHWNHYWIHTDGPGVSALADIINENQKLSPVPVPDTVRDSFEHLMLRIPQETTAAVLSVSLDVHRILQQMASSSLHEARQLHLSRQNRIEEAAEYIREHYAEDLHIETLLDLTHLSRSYFLRLFRQYMGTTPYNFLLLTRITRAKVLLETTDLPVSQISYEVGFQTETNFSARFQALAKVSPGQYRRQALSGR